MVSISNCFKLRRCWNVFSFSINSSSLFLIRLVKIEQLIQKILFPIGLTNSFLQQTHFLDGLIELSFAWLFCKMVIFIFCNQPSFSLATRTSHPLKITFCFPRIIALVTSCLHDSIWWWWLINIVVMSGGGGRLCFKSSFLFHKGLLMNASQKLFIFPRMKVYDFMNTT